MKLVVNLAGLHRQGVTCYPNTVGGCDEINKMSKTSRGMRDHLGPLGILWKRHTQLRPGNHSMAHDRFPPLICC